MISTFSVFVPASLGRSLGALVALVSVAGAARCTPVINVEPQDQTNVVGSTIRFEVESTGLPPLTYQWMSQSSATSPPTITLLPDATNTWLTVSNVQSAQMQYAVAVSDPENTVTSRWASVTIATPPSLPVARWPRSQAILLNASATFSVTPLGTAPLFYQWRFEGRDLPDKTNRSLTLTKLQADQEGMYSVTISNAFGNVVSPPARLTVLPSYTNLIARVRTNALGKLPYRLFKPVNYTPDQHYPLVLFMHGAGEVGTDNARQLSVWPNSMVYISCLRQQTQPLFFVAPQSPSAYWNMAGMQTQLLDLLDTLTAEFSIDTNRIYITGLSMGGMGSWGLLERRPSYFAAAMPICGNGNTLAAPTFRDVAVWDFHAADDSSVPVAGSRDMIAAIRRAGGTPLYTEYVSGGHGIWVEAYATPGLVEWTLAQRRGERIKNSPTVEIAGVPANGQWSTRESTLELEGSTDAWGEAITQIKWSNTATNQTGSGVASNPWRLTVPLVAGRTNLVTVIAGTVSFAPERGGATTFSATLPVLADLPVVMAYRQVGGKLTLDWAGGAPPYLLQKAQEPGEGWWQDALPDAKPPVTVPLDDEAGFFRVRSP